MKVEVCMETDKIFEMIYKQIINLDLLPEKVLNLNELAESFQVSRTPIKEVLRYGKDFG